MASGKYNYKKLINDLRGDDLDIVIFGLRTIIKINRGQLGAEDVAVPALVKVVVELLPLWPEEVIFYGQRALEHLKTLEREEVSDDDESFEDALIDLEALSSDNKRIVLDTLKKIEVQKYSDGRELILKMLKTADDSLVISALLSALGQIGNSSDLFVVKNFTGHTNDRVRATCVAAIGGLSEDLDVVKAMVEPFLKDRGGLPRAAAVRIVAPLDFALVGEAVNLSILSDNVSDRAAMAEALCSIECDEAVPYIKQLSEDSDETVRMKILESLERGDHGQKAFILKRMVKDPSPLVAKVAREALRRYETQRMLSIGGFKSMLPQDLPAARKMKEIEDMQGAEELDPIDLDDLKDPDITLKLVCLRKIRQRSYQKAYEAVVDLLGVAENVDILAATISSLTVIGSGDDVPALSHFVAHGASSVRVATAGAIDQLATKEQAMYLLLPMIFDESAAVCLAAGRAMKRIPVEEILAALNRMAGHSSRAVKITMVKVLSHFSGSGVIKVFYSYLRTQDPSFRMMVLKSLFKQKDPRATEMLSALANDSNRKISSEAKRFITIKARPGFEDTQPDLPPLSSFAEVLDDIVLRSEKEVEAQLAEEASSRVEAGNVNEAGLVERISVDLTSRKELSMLELNRKVIHMDMGKKVYRLILKKEVNHKAYEKAVFLIKKFKHQETSVPHKAAENKGFWGQIKEAAGMEKDDGELKKLNLKIDDQYAELGRIAFLLSYTENEIYPDLHMEYIELESVENKIARKKEILGLKGK
jgi:HEAT repeat protein